MCRIAAVSRAETSCRCVLGAPTLTPVFTNVLQSYRPTRLFASHLRHLLKMNDVKGWLVAFHCRNLHEVLLNMQCVFLVKWRRCPNCEMRPVCEYGGQCQIMPSVVKFSLASCVVGSRHTQIFYKDWLVAFICNSKEQVIGATSLGLPACCIPDHGQHNDRVAQNITLCFKVLPLSTEAASLGVPLQFLFAYKKHFRGTPMPLATPSDISFYRRKHTCDVQVSTCACHTKFIYLDDCLCP